MLFILSINSCPSLGLDGSVLPYFRLPSSELKCVPIYIVVDEFVDVDELVEDDVEVVLVLELVLVVVVVLELVEVYT